MRDGEIEGEDTGVSACGLIHPEPPRPARLALNRRSPYFSCWRSLWGCKATRVALAGSVRSLRIAPIPVGQSSRR